MKFMDQALELASKVAGELAPRPPVGAVVVAADGETVVGKGATEPYPGLHAEEVALRMAGERARGGTIYCTLEPHQHQSSRPPCAQTIVDAGIKHVVCPAIDPNPIVSGKGIEHIEAAGIRYTRNVTDDQQRFADELIEGFAKHVVSGLPFVTVKWAMSIDGKIATHGLDAKWISCKKARAHAHGIRYRSDAIMTGIGTVLADDPKLTARDPETGERVNGRPYKRIVIDSQAQMPADAALLSEEGEVIHAVAVPGFDDGRCNVLQIPPDVNGRVKLLNLMSQLGKLGIMNILVEAGQTLNGALFDLGLVDKVIVYISKTKVIGGANAVSPVGGVGPQWIENSARLANAQVMDFEEDIAIIARVKQPARTC